MGLLSFQRDSDLVWKLHNLWRATSSIIFRERQPNKENKPEESQRTSLYSLVNGSSFLASELLLIVLSVFTNFTSVESHYRWNGSCKRLSSREVIGKHLSGATHQSHTQKACRRNSAYRSGRILLEKRPHWATGGPVIPIFSSFTHV